MATELIPSRHSIAPASISSVGGALGGFRVIGVSHKTAPLKTRGAISFNEAAARELLAELRSKGCAEALVLSTCNRTEVYFYDLEDDEVLSAMAGLTEVCQAKLYAVSYRHEGREAVRQLFRVASGLDSAVLGEHEILGQLKVAHRIAKSAGTVGRRLDPLFQRALRSSKRVRHESELGKEVTSIGSMAVRKASALAGGLDGKLVLLIGAGQIAERVAKGIFHCEGVKGYVTNRTAEKAERLAEMYRLETWDFRELDRALHAVDVVICAVSSPTPVLRLEQLRAARSNRGIVLVDLGVPPNVEESAKHESGIKVVDMEAIVNACHANSQARAAAVPHANEIVDAEVAAYEQEAIEREAAPYIKALSEAAESVRTKNLEWALGQDPDATDQQRKVLEDLSIRIVRGMLSGPIQALKTELRAPVERAVLARLFSGAVEFEEASER